MRVAKNGDAIVTPPDTKPGMPHCTSSLQAVTNDGKLWPKGFWRRSYVCFMVK
jgi:hypothetical protein